MGHALIMRGGNRLARRPQIDVEKLLRLAWRRVRHADQLKERVARRDRPGKRPAVEGIADDDLTVAGDSGLGSAARERPHAVATLEQARDETAANVTGAASDKHVEIRTFEDRRSKFEVSHLKREATHS